MKSYTREQLIEILELHRKWLRDEEDGKRADLRGADLRDAKEDLFEILDSAPNEVPGVLSALQEGRVNGSTYSGECACLVGTIANIRQCEYDKIEGIIPDSSRPAEKWFLAIRTGDTPENHPIAKITAEWVQEWLDKNKVEA